MPDQNKNTKDTVKYSIWETRTDEKHSINGKRETIDLSERKERK